MIAFNTLLLTYIKNSLTDDTAVHLVPEKLLYSVNLDILR